MSFVPVYALMLEVPPDAPVACVLPPPGVERSRRGRPCVVPARAYADGWEHEVALLEAYRERFRQRTGREAAASVTLEQFRRGNVGGAA